MHNVGWQGDSMRRFGGGTALARNLRAHLVVLVSALLGLAPSCAPPIVDRSLLAGDLGVDEAYHVAITSMPDFKSLDAVVYRTGEGAFGEARADGHLGCPISCCSTVCDFAVPDQRAQRKVDAAEWEQLERAVEAAGFWGGRQLVTRHEVFDGWSVTLQGLRGRQSRETKGRNPVEDELVQLVDLIVAMAGARPDRGQGSYDPVTNELRFREEAPQSH